MGDSGRVEFKIKPGEIIRDGKNWAIAYYASLEAEETEIRFEKMPAPFDSALVSFGGELHSARYWSLK